MANDGLSVVFAYVDPGTGSMLLQWIIALVLGSGLYFRRTIARLFRRRGKEEPESKDSDS